MKQVGHRVIGKSMNMNAQETHIINAVNAMQDDNDSHRALTGNEAAEYIATCTTDLRAFIHFGRGQATCYGPIAENIHAANERVNIDSVMHVARAYALFLSRWCGLVE